MTTSATSLMFPVRSLCLPSLAFLWVPWPLSRISFCSVLDTRRCTHFLLLLEAWRCTHGTRLPGADRLPCPLSNQGGSRLPPRVPSTSIAGRSRLPPSGMSHRNARTPCHPDESPCLSLCCYPFPMEVPGFPLSPCPSCPGASSDVHQGQVCW